MDSLKNKAVLVTGGAGIIGQELVALLVAEGALVRVVDMVEKPSSLVGFDYFQMDLANRDSQFLFHFEPEYVFHLAADFERSTESLEFWDANFKNNILASHYLLEQIMKCKSLKKIVFASSYLIYDKNQYNDVSKEGVLSESSMVNPRNLCGVAKLQTEKDLEFFHEQLKSFEYACARIYRVYGRGSRDIASRWVRAALKGEALEVFSKNNRFDYIFAGDVAEGLIRICKAEAAKGIINLGSGISHSVAELVEVLKSNFADLKIVENDKMIYPEASMANVSLLKKLTGWSPQTSLNDGVSKLIEHERS